jgi:pSer/pThr/pTyr-binding forkhead associated (FHA) protein
MSQQSLIESLPVGDSTETKSTGSNQQIGPSISFQLIPFSDIPSKPPLGEVVERTIKEGQILRIGRQVFRDGQPVMRGTKILGDEDIWFVSKVVSRIHAELWFKDNQLYIRDIGSSSGTFLNKMRLSPSGKESRPYPIKQGDSLQFGIDFKGKPDDIYKSVSVKVGFHDQSWIKASRTQANQTKFVFF